MANDQYRIPGQVGEGPLQDAIRIADSFQYTPEKQPETFQFLKNIETEWYASREAALELSRAKSKGKLTSFGWIRPALQLGDLMKMESEMNGELFGKDSGHRFWLDHKSTAYYGQQNTIGDWYHAQPAVLPNGKPTEVVLHYKTTPNQIEKLYNGNSYALTLEEIQNFCHAVIAARDLTREKMYPLDDSIHDLEVEIEEEQIIAPTTEEVMFSQAAVQRMIDEYRAKKALENDDKDDYKLAA
jgi:hypothetical protein